MFFSLAKYLENIQFPSYEEAMRMSKRNKKRDSVCACVTDFFKKIRDIRFVGSA